MKSAGAVPTCCASLACASSWLFGLESLQAFQRDIAGDVDLDSDTGVTIALQFVSILAWRLLRVECSFDTRFEGSDNSHARKQHGAAIFGGIDEHLDGKPPFPTITL
ncbi:MULTISPECIES: hypothetical protein [unclassified Bradyrhizobium]|uniref:hypothetical protein n=1 Tax=unclassified Bradyrhizobium TaxID=2631580 RepID=UPI002FF2C16D